MKKEEEEEEKTLKKMLSFIAVVVVTHTFLFNIAVLTHRGGLRITSDRFT